MRVEIYYSDKQGCTDWFPRVVDVKSVKAALSYASRHWTYGCGDITVFVNGRRYDRCFWYQSGQWGLYNWNK